MSDNEKANKDESTVGSPAELLELLGGRAESAQKASQLINHNVREFSGKNMNEPCNAWDVIQICCKVVALQNENAE
jgi:hypothetical protein